MAMQYDPATWHGIDHEADEDVRDMRRNLDDREDDLQGYADDR